MSYRVLSVFMLTYGVYGVVLVTLGFFYIFGGFGAWGFRVRVPHFRLSGSRL